MARVRARQVEERESGGGLQTHQPSLEHRVLNGGMAGGALAMLIAVVWFAAGLMNDWVFFYPPILFILGLIAFIKGLTGEE